jgi:hypothetical protein
MLWDAVGQRKSMRVVIDECEYPTSRREVADDVVGFGGEVDETHREAHYGVL